MGSSNKDGILTVLGLSPRAGHPQEKLQLLHGSLFEIKCSEFFCDYFEANNFTDPIVPALALPLDESDPTSNEARQAISNAIHRKKELDISDENVPLPELRISDLPRCPKCKHGILRPGVVWFGEALPSKVLQNVDAFLSEPENIDLIMVIGTSARVYPAAGYVDLARAKGAKVAVVNLDFGDAPASGLQKGDWFFRGDAAKMVPEMLEGVVGKIAETAAL